jgi:hypothetical protein
VNSGLFGVSRFDVSLAYITIPVRPSLGKTVRLGSSRRSRTTCTDGNRVDIVREGARRGSRSLNSTSLQRLEDRWSVLHTVVATPLPSDIVAVDFTSNSLFIRLH